MPARLLGEMTSPEFDALDKTTPLLVPVGIVEEHGPHLPLDTDSIQAEWTCRAVAERADAIVAPLLAYGNCSSTRRFPGSLSMRFDTMRAIARDILDETHRNGLQTVMFLSSHAGGAHMRALKLAAEEHVEAVPERRVFVLTEFDVLGDFDAQAAGGVDVPAWDGHAGCIETSRMMAIRPDLVGTGAEDHRVRFPDALVEAHPEHRFPSGVMGAPTLATEKLGHAVNEHVVTRIVDILRQRA